MFVLTAPSELCVRAHAVPIVGNLTGLSAASTAGKVEATVTFIAAQECFEGLDLFGGHNPSHELACLCFADTRAERHDSGGHPLFRHRRSAEYILLCADQFVVSRHLRGLG